NCSAACRGAASSDMLVSCSWVRSSSEAARVHHSANWYGSVAARGSGTAGASDDRIAGHWSSGSPLRTTIAQLAWIENRTVAIEYLWVEGRVERYTRVCPPKGRRYCQIGRGSRRG